MDGSRPDRMPAGDAQAATAPGQQQEPEQQGRTAHLADADGRPGRAGLASVGAGHRGEQVEGDGEGFPGEEEAEGVGCAKDDRHRAQQEQVAGGDASALGPVVGADPGHETSRDGDRDAEAQRQEQPGQRVEEQGGVSDPELIREIDGGGRRSGGINPECQQAGAAGHRQQVRGQSQDAPAHPEGHAGREAGQGGGE